MGGTDASCRQATILSNVQIIILRSFSYHVACMIHLASLSTLPVVGAWVARMQTPAGRELCKNTEREPHQLRRPYFGSPADRALPMIPRGTTEPARNYLEPPGVSSRQVLRLLDGPRCCSSKYPAQRDLPDDSRTASACLGSWYARKGNWGYK